MQRMERALRNVAALVAGLALVAALPGPCPCPESAPERPSEHGCCAPPTGVSPADHGCCDGHDDAAADALAPAPAPAAPPPGAAVAVRLDPALWLVGPPHGAAAPFPSPPPTVLRI
jgi:hypothetical protein